MKNLLPYLLIPVFALVGCAHTSVSTTPPAATISTTTLTFVQTGATVATGVVLDLAEKSPSERTQLANQIYASASALYTLTGGAVPTPAQFNSTLASYGVTGVSQYTQYATDIDAIYASFYAKYAAGTLTGANIIAVINALAQGAEAGASSYATLPTATATVLKTHVDLRAPYGSRKLESAYDLHEVASNK